MRVGLHIVLSVLLIPWGIVTGGFGFLAMLFSLPLWLWAKRWGRDGWGWFLFGSYLSAIVAALCILALGRKPLEGQAPLELTKRV